VAVAGKAYYTFFVANVNVNSDGLKVNVNRFENDNVWSAEYAHRLVVPATNYFLLILIKPLFHPPIIFPILFNFSDNSVYLLLAMHLFSQAICKKNFKLSNLAEHSSNFSIFSFLGRYRESRILSKIIRKVSSISPPLNYIGIS
jgi:hypothetical protein